MTTHEPNEAAERLRDYLAEKRVGWDLLTTADLLTTLDAALATERQRTVPDDIRERHAGHSWETCPDWDHSQDLHIILDSIVRAAPADPLSELPPHSRLILASEYLLEGWGTRTEDGYRLSAEWGEPNDLGHYTPTFTIDYADDLRATERQRTVERIRERALGWRETEHYGRTLPPWLEGILDSISCDENGGTP